ncbi:MAG: phosphatase PAP2 family protein [Alphaproteobacteria bacterium]|nr:phosphatase PAP2 family protein [Alphaproteobacteria bacterium]MDE2500956.1 phosphatase PAP2 family protein [Alphaproteobacteria bacterium]
MAPRLQYILLSIVAAVLSVDVIWASLVHFDIDTNAYLAIAALSATLAGGGLFYDRVRKDVRLSAMLLGTSFLVAFSASFSVLNYFLLTVAGTRIDAFLAQADRAMGFDWPSMMAFMSRHPGPDLVLKYAYESVLPQIALLIALLGWKSRCQDISGLCLAIAIGAVATVIFWAAFPSFGAITVYRLDASVASHLNVALDGRYANDLLNLLATGPGRISPHEVKGLVGFPSFHAALAVMVAWYARRLAYLRWPIGALDLLVVVSTPIQGGHHVVDVAGGLAVAALAVALSHRIVAAARVHRPQAESVVQEASRAAA